MNKASEPPCFRCGSEEAWFHPTLEAPVCLACVSCLIALPCPFCGATPWVAQTANFGTPRSHQVQCSNSKDCYAIPSVNSSDRAEAIRLWNIRKTPTETTGNS